MDQEPLGLIQTFWDDTKKLFNISNDDAKRMVFEFLVAERLRGFKTLLANRWIHKKNKPKNKKACKGKDNEGGNGEAVEEDQLSWQKGPSVTEDQWKAFVVQ